MSLLLTHLISNRMFQATMKMMTVTLKIISDNESYVLINKD